MLTVDEYGRVRRAHRDGMSIREIARTFRHSRRKVRQILVEPEPTPYVRGRSHCPKLGSFHVVIDQILIDDQTAPRKQRHTAMQVFRRLVTEEGYRGGYDAVRRYMLAHPPQSQFVNPNRYELLLAGGDGRCRLSMKNATVSGILSVVQHKQEAAPWQSFRRSIS